MEKKRSKAILLLGLCTVIILALAYSLSFSQEVKQFPLKLIIKSDKKTYRLGELINIDLSFKNISKKQIKLFHPDSINKGWCDWELKCYITKPNGKEVILEPSIFYSAVYFPKKEHYKSLTYGDVINLSIRFKIKRYVEGAWVGLIEISEEEDKKPPEEIRRNYNIKGGFYYISGDKLYLALEDIITDVFNLEGEYKLKFQYKNSYNMYDVPDETKPSALKIIVVPDAWTGTLSNTITIEIIK